MIKFRGTVFYRDGREETYEAGGGIQAEWETYAMRHDYPTVPTPETLTRFPVKLWQQYLAYAAIGTAKGFDVWRREVLDVETQDEPEAVPPTLPEAIAASSLNSPSPPAGAWTP